MDLSVTQRGYDAQYLPGVLSEKVCNSCTADNFYKFNFDHHSL